MKNSNILFTFFTKYWIPITQNVKSYFTALALFLLLTGTLQAGLDNQCTACTVNNQCDKQTECEAYGCDWTAGSPNNLCQDPPPTSNAGPDQPNVNRNTIVTLDGSGSSTVNGNALTYSWSFTTKPAGSTTATLSDATAEEPTFTPDVDGNYVIQLIVNDGTFDSNADSVTVTAINAVPVADAGNNQNVTTNTTVTLDGSSSSDANGDTLTYSWSFTTKPAGSTTATLSDATAEEPTFTPDVDGNYVIQLIVNDGTFDSNADSVTITASAVPVTDVDLTISKTAVFGGSVVTYVDVNTTFEYVIDVTNQGPATASNIIVTDTLPVEITYISSSSSDWTCSEGTNGLNAVITCTHDSTIANDNTSAIILNVLSHLDEGIITNEVNVTCDDELDFSDNNTSLVTRVVKTSEPAGLCYAESEGDGNKCEVVGDFYYGPSNPHGCIASAKIHNISGEPLSNVTVYKLYDDNVNNGSCTSTNCSGTPYNIPTLSGYTEYGGGYTYSLNSMSADTNQTISDTNTYYSTQAVDDIILYGEYTRDSIVYAGRIRSCGFGSIDLSDFSPQVDFVDDVITDTNQYEGAIRTKISNKPNYQMKTYFLGDAGEIPDANAEFESSISANKDIDMTIVMYLSDDTCSETVRLTTVPGGTTPVTAVLTDGDSDSLSDSFTMAYTDQILAKRVARYKYKTLNLGGLIDTSNINCPNSSTNGSASGTVTGIPACITSTSSNSTPADRYKQIFGDTAFTRCWENLVKGQPCLSSSNAGTTPPPYDHEYGCLECSLGDIPYTCSRDAFAIRPDHFDIDTTDTDFPNLLRSGEDYNMTVYAHDYGITASTIASGSNDYNQTGGEDENIDLNQTRYYKNGVLEDNSTNPLHGDLVWSAWDFNMTNGISNQNNIFSPLPKAIEVAGIQYDDVGKINISVEDRDWAAVDINNSNDPTPRDCSDDGAYLCGDRNVTYIPHHFGFAELNITNHAGPDDSEFTYVADRRGMPSTGTLPTRSPMAGRIEARIEALNKNGIITENFRADDEFYPYDDSVLYYENDVNITMMIKVPSTGINTYLYPDANESNVTNSYIGFGRTSLDLNGTRNVQWNEADFPLDFNFPREIDNEANPFDVNGTYLKSIIIKSHYIDPDDGETADINGSRISEDSSCTSDPNCVQNNAENNATFYYGRTRASQYFYKDITTDEANTPITATIYCRDNATINCNDYRFNTALDGIDEPDWYLSMDHNATRGDGNVTIIIGSPLIEPIGTAATDQAVVIDGTSYTYSSGNAGNVLIITNGVKNDVNVSRGSGPIPPLTVPVELVQDGDSAAPPYTHEWLIYNKFFPAPPSPFYKVRFINESTWTGEGQTGHVVDINASYKKTNRADW